jgi:hypothetical protein
MFPWFGHDVNGIPHWGLFVIFFEVPSHASETLSFLAMFTLMFGIPATALGWVVQCFLVMAVAKFRRP